MSDIDESIERLTDFVLRLKLTSLSRAQFSHDILHVIELAKDRLKQGEEFERMKAEVIRMRQYAQRKSIPIGECVAWSNIKKFYGTGVSDETDFAWLAAYEQEQKAKH